MSHNLCRPPWKQCALLLILLSHAVFGSPIVPTIASNYKSLEPSSQAGISGPKSVQVSHLQLYNSKLLKSHTHISNFYNLSVSFFIICEFLLSRKFCGIDNNLDKTLKFLMFTSYFGGWHFQTSLEEDIFGPNLDERSNRKKRLFYETLKKAKQAKFLALMTATSDTFKSVAQSVFKNVVTLGIKFVIFNFLYAVRNKLLPFICT